MKPEEIAGLILDGHCIKQKNLSCIRGFRLDLQLDYSGLMAKKAYEGWRKNRHRNRRKVGCFDFQIYRINDSQEIPINHIRVIKQAHKTLTEDLIEKVFVGEDPLNVGTNQDEKIVLQEVQLAMLEQEINWGDEPFQCWTHFLPSKGKRPRDFIMAYLRRIFKEPDLLKRTGKIRAASGTHGTLPPPIGSEWRDFREPKDSGVKPWMAGELLNKFRKVSEGMRDNPEYERTYRE